MLGLVNPLKAGVRAVSVMGIILSGMAGTVVFAADAFADGPMHPHAAGASVSGPELAIAQKESDDLLLLEKDGKDELLDTDTEKKGVCEINVAKNRTGPTGVVEMLFLKNLTRFENLAARPS